MHGDELLMVRVNPAVERQPLRKKLLVEEVLLLVDVLGPALDSTYIRNETRLDILHSMPASACIHGQGIQAVAQSANFVLDV